MSAGIHRLPVKARRLEIHEHCIIQGPRANSTLYMFSHSHEGGDTPHRHPDTGPACYTIDRDEWFRMTGLKGGGRKEFSAAPTGEQFPLISSEPKETEFEVIVCDPSAPPDFKGEGGGVYAASRMVLAFGMRAVVKPGGPLPRKMQP